MMRHNHMLHFFRLDRYALVMIVVISSLLLTLSGCTQSTPMPRTSLTGPLQGPYHTTPAPGRTPMGELVFADSEFPISANPLFASTNADITINSALWGQPIFYDQYFRVHADQLTEVPLPENGGVLDDGKTIIMHLQPDLRWSDGEPVKASDFLYWWRLNQDRNTGATIRTGYDQIASIETPDPFTVVLRMKRAFGPYLSYLPQAAPQHIWGQLQPVELQNMLNVFQAPRVTSGPYKLVEMVEGQRYVLEPNTHYTSTTFNRPHIARLVYQAYSSTGELIQAVQQKRSDVSQGYRENDLPALTSHLPPGTRILKEPAAAYEHLDFNLARPYLQDLQVRKALAMAIDVCHLIRTVLHEPDCTRRATQVEQPPSLFHDTTIPASPYDPDAARKLLAQAGWQLNGQGLLQKNGQAFHLRLVTTEHNAIRQATATAIQRALATLGIQVTIDYYPLSKLFDGFTQGGILATGAYDMALFAYANSAEPDGEYDVFHSSQIPDTDQPDLGNYGRINDAMIDQALTQGRDTVVFAERVSAYHRFLRRLAEQVYILPLYRDVSIMTVNTHTRNVIPNPNSAANSWNISDWWKTE